MVIVINFMLSVRYYCDSNLCGISVRDYFYSVVAIIMSAISILYDMFIGNILLRNVRFCIFYLLSACFIIYSMYFTLRGNMYMLFYCFIVVTALFVKLTGTKIVLNVDGNRPEA